MITPPKLNTVLFGALPKFSVAIVAVDIVIDPVPVIVFPLATNALIDKALLVVKIAGIPLSATPPKLNIVPSGKLLKFCTLVIASTTVKFINCSAVIVLPVAIVAVIDKSPCIKNIFGIPVSATPPTLNIV